MRPWHGLARGSGRNGAGRRGAPGTAPVWRGHWRSARHIAPCRQGLRLAVRRAALSIRSTPGAAPVSRRRRATAFARARSGGARLRRRAVRRAAAMRHCASFPRTCRHARRSLRRPLLGCCTRPGGARRDRHGDSRLRPRAARCSSHQHSERNTQTRRNAHLRTSHRSLSPALHALHASQIEHRKPQRPALRARHSAEHAVFCERARANARRKACRHPTARAERSGSGSLLERAQRAVSRTAPARLRLATARGRGAPSSPGQQRRRDQHRRSGRRSVIRIAACLHRAPPRTQRGGRFSLRRSSSAHSLFAHGRSRCRGAAPRRPITLRCSSGCIWHLSWGTLGHRACLSCVWLLARRCGCLQRPARVADAVQRRTLRPSAAPSARARQGMQRRARERIAAPSSICGVSCSAPPCKPQQRSPEREGHQILCRVRRFAPCSERRISLGLLSCGTASPGTHGAAQEGGPGRRRRCGQGGRAGSRALRRRRRRPGISRDACAFLSCVASSRARAHGRTPFLLVSWPKQILAEGASA
jgi:hypothetical protein